MKFEIILPLLCFLVDPLTKDTTAHGVVGEILGPVKSKESCCQQGQGLIIIT